MKTARGDSWGKGESPMPRLLYSVAISAALGMVQSLPADDVGAGQGYAIGTVLHTVTGEPLAGMPVIVQQLIWPEGVFYVYKTEEDGRAIVGPLPSGTYVAYVSFNNNQSDRVVFDIVGGTDWFAVFTLKFNPDIDPGE